MFGLTGRGSSRRKEENAGQDGHVSLPQFEQLEDRLLLSLLGVAVDFQPPEISYNSTGTVVYDAVADTFDCNAVPLGIILEVGDRPLRFDSLSDFQLHIRIDESGNLIGGSAGDDLLIAAKVTDRRAVVFDGESLPSDGPRVLIGDLRLPCGEPAVFD